MYRRRLYVPTQGYTLIELLIVMALITTLVSFAIPSFLSFNKKAVLSENTVGLMDGLRLARSKAEGGIQDSTAKIENYRFELLPVAGDPIGYYRGYRVVRVDEDDQVFGQSLEQSTLACGMCVQSDWAGINYDVPSGLATGMSSQEQSFRVCSPDLGYYDVEIDLSGRIERGDFQSGAGGCTCVTICGDAVVPSVVPTPVVSPTVVGPTPTVTPLPTPTVTLTPTPTSVPTPPAPTPTPVTNRVINGLVAFYPLEEASGNMVNDVSGVGTAVNTTIANPSAVSWISGGIVVNSETAFQSSGAATKIIDALKTSNEITVETWLRPANTAQNGPARILSLSQNSSLRNFMLGQDGDRYVFRLRTTTNSLNGTVPPVNAQNGTVTTDLTHVVYTRNGTGQAVIYVNGVERGSGLIDGDFSNWDDSYPLTFVNEPSIDRGWLGELYLTAIYSRALSSDEVQQNYAAGEDDSGGYSPSYDVNIRISELADDAEETLTNGVVNITSSDLEMGAAGTVAQSVGLRFQSLPIPRGATVINAYLEFTTDEVDTVSTNLTIAGQAADNAPPFTATTNNITSRPKTGATVNWNSIPAWQIVGEVHRSPALTSIVQEIVNRSGWSVGNSIVFVVDGPGERTAEAYAGNIAITTLLHIEYQP